MYIIGNRIIEVLRKKKENWQRLRMIAVVKSQIWDIEGSIIKFFFK